MAQSETVRRLVHVGDEKSGVIRIEANMNIVRQPYEGPFVEILVDREGYVVPWFMLISVVGRDAAAQVKSPA